MASNAARAARPWEDKGLVGRRVPAVGESAARRACPCLVRRSRRAEEGCGREGGEVRKYRITGGGATSRQAASERATTGWSVKARFRFEERSRDGGGRACEEDPGDHLHLTDARTHALRGKARCTRPVVQRRGGGRARRAAEKQRERSSAPSLVCEPRLCKQEQRPPRAAP